MLTKIIVLSFIVALSAAQRSYPTFRQCDLRWRLDIMGASSRNMCDAGCFITCISMILNYCGISINGGTANPRSFNNWLSNNRGYVGGNQFVWDSVDRIGLDYIGQVSNARDIRYYFNNDYSVILNVRNGAHFVLMTGATATGYNAIDPRSLNSFYSNTDVTRAFIYGSYDCHPFLKSNFIADEALT